MSKIFFGFMSILVFSAQLSARTIRCEAKFDNGNATDSKNINFTEGQAGTKSIKLEGYEIDVSYTKLSINITIKNNNNNKTTSYQENIPKAGSRTKNKSSKKTFATGSRDYLSFSCKV